MVDWLGLWNHFMQAIDRNSKLVQGKLDGRPIVQKSSLQSRCLLLWERQAGTNLSRAALN